MIQRVQSIFLFLVALAMVAVVFLPIWFQVNPGQTQAMDLTAWYLTVKSVPDGEIISKSGNYYIGILAIAAGILALYSLMQYRNRKRQLFLNMINALVMGTTLGLAVFVSYQANLDFNPKVSGAYVIGFYSIIFALIMNIIANRFIRKDEMLVRSVDRIR
ncbi:DUF4293 domain-containing protein [Negadavirga shengliensis]|uniref:DUF4293 domain-containing protein n=1 Tax=Negadavirga shengliensis TaxID=1389218 RepID=A0ABV9T306_9BACT